MKKLFSLLLLGLSLSTSASAYHYRQIPLTLNIDHLTAFGETQNVGNINATLSVSEESMMADPQYFSHPDKTRTIYAYRTKFSKLKLATGQEIPVVYSIEWLINCTSYYVSEERCESQDLLVHTQIDISKENSETIYKALGVTQENIGLFPPAITPKFDVHFDAFSIDEPERYDSPVSNVTEVNTPEGSESYRFTIGAQHIKLSPRPVVE